MVAPGATACPKNSPSEEGLVSVLQTSALIFSRIDSLEGGVSTSEDTGHFGNITSLLLQREFSVGIDFVMFTNGPDT